MIVLCDTSDVGPWLQEVKVTSPDYKGMSPDEACKDYFARIDHYRKAYEPLSMELDRYMPNTVLICSSSNLFAVWTFVILK